MSLLVATNIIISYEYARRKGRTHVRKIVNPHNRQRLEKAERFAVERIKAGDPEWTKFLHKPPE